MTVLGWKVSGWIWRPVEIEVILENTHDTKTRLALVL